MCPMESSFLGLKLETFACSAAPEPAGGGMISYTSDSSEHSQYSHYTVMVTSNISCSLTGKFLRLSAPFRKHLGPGSRIPAVETSSFKAPHSIRKLMAPLLDCESALGAEQEKRR